MSGEAQVGKLAQKGDPDNLKTLGGSAIGVGDAQAEHHPEKERAQTDAISAFRNGQIVGSRRHQAMNWSVQLHAGRGNGDLLIRDAKMIMDWVWENHE